MDLVENNLIAESSSNPVSFEFRISCKTGRNMPKLLNFIDSKLKQIRGLTNKKLTYGFDKHYLVVEWLRKNANISFNLNESHNYEPS